MRDIERSRMTARGITVALPTPSACTTATRSERRRPRRVATATDPTTDRAKTAEAAAAPAEVVGQGAEQKLAYRQTREKGRQGELHGARVRLQVRGRSPAGPASTCPVKRGTDRRSVAPRRIRSFENPGCFETAPGAALDRAVDIGCL